MMSSELKWIIVSVVCTILTFVFPRARVLTIPFVFTILLIGLFWRARVIAQRDEE